ncbi:MAG TPA: hypothetical protein VF669_03820 [Tepidisphaeraceae bacterium]|jgi:hypothetical protein
MELHDAVAQITQIRQQLAESTTFRGYRPATTAFTGVVALAAAAIQSLFIDNPERHPLGFIDIWVSAALLCIVVVGAELMIWSRRSASHMRSEMTIAAVHQFAPCIAAGGLLTLVICWYQGQVIWTLAGVWPILFSTGMFASVRMVGKGLLAVGGFYLLAGLLILSRGPALAMWPWYMGLTFGVGQFLAAAVLFLKRKSEVEHEQQ